MTKEEYQKRESRDLIIVITIMILLVFLAIIGIVEMKKDNAKAFPNATIIETDEKHSNESLIELEYNESKNINKSLELAQNESNNVSMNLSEE